MSEMDDMRAMNKKPIAAANSNKTLSGGAGEPSAADKARAKNAQKLSDRATSMRAKAKAQQDAQYAAWEAARAARLRAARRK